jgi:hypothetical protein
VAPLLLLLHAVNEKSCRVGAEAWVARGPLSDPRHRHGAPRAPLRRVENSEISALVR